MPQAEAPPSAPLSQPQTGESLIGEGEEGEEGEEKEEGKEEEKEEKEEKEEVVGETRNVQQNIGVGGISSGEVGGPLEGSLERETLWCEKSKLYGHG